MEIICNSSIKTERIYGGRRLLEDVSVSIDGVTHVIRAGYEWDGASIPKFVRGIYGDPFDAIHELAGLVHDAIYGGVITGYTRAEADDIYYAIIRANGQTWWRARKEWLAIRLFGGPHWAPRESDNCTISISAFVLCAAILSGGCATKTRSVELDGMYVSEAGTLAIGSVEVMAAPVGEETATIKYSEDTAWLSPSTKTHEIKIMMTGTNSVNSASAIVASICDAFVKAAPALQSTPPDKTVSAEIRDEAITP